MTSRSLLWVVSFLLVSSSFADAPTSTQIEAYRAHFDQLESKSPYSGRREKPCFYERLCALGPNGSSFRCEESMSLCLSDATRSGASRLRASSQNDCRILFDSFTPKQLALLSNPVGCDAPPPLSATLPPLTQQDTACMAPKFCSVIDAEGYYESCVDTLETCTKPMANLRIRDRAWCRTSRYIAEQNVHGYFGNGSCQGLSAAQPLWSEDSNRTVSTSTLSDSGDDTEPVLEDEFDMSF